jgi:hypothetical protein
MLSARRNLEGLDVRHIYLCEMTDAGHVDKIMLGKQLGKHQHKQLKRVRYETLRWICLEQLAVTM